MIPKLRFVQIAFIGVCECLFLQVSGQKLSLSTASDSALFYYYQGWEQVLDYGHFTNSESAYRDMYRHDPNLLVGVCLLARITQDPDERRKLIADVERDYDKVSGDEKMLLRLFLDLAKLYLLRETGQSDKIADHLDQTFTNGEKTLALLSRKYPQDIYYKSEYIEVLHRNYGAQKALDSLSRLFPEPPPFMQGYKSQLLSELGRYESAREEADRLQEVLDIDQAPYVSMVYAKLHQEKGEIEVALEYVSKALSIDPRHILALRLKEELATTR